MDEYVQKAGVPWVPGCVKHAYTFWDTIQSAKNESQNLDVICLDLASAYSSVPHKLIKLAMEYFCFPETIQDLLMEYYDNFCYAL